MSAAPPCRRALVMLSALLAPLSGGSRRPITMPRRAIMHGPLPPLRWMPRGRALLLLTILPACHGEGLFRPDLPQSPLAAVVEVQVTATGLELDDAVVVLVNGAPRGRLQPGFGPVRTSFRVDRETIRVALGDVASNCTVEPDGGLDLEPARGALTSVILQLSCRATGSLAGARLAVAGPSGVSVFEHDVPRYHFPGWSAAWSPDAGLLAVAADEGTIVLRDAAAGMAPRGTIRTTPARPADLAWSPHRGGGLIFTNIFWEDDYGWTDASARLLSLAVEGDAGWEVRPLSALDLWTPAWAPDGGLAVAAGYRSLERFGPGGESLGPLFTREGASLRSPAFTPDGEVVLYIENGVLRRHEMASGTDLPVPVPWTHWITSVTVLMDGRLVLGAATVTPAGYVTTCLFVTDPEGRSPHLLTDCEYSRQAVRVAPARASTGMGTGQ